jgi:hypothetical protein
MAKVDDTEENFQLCLQEHCGNCPSYPDVEGEALYCARGGSEARIQRVECVCPDCPIWAEHGLSRLYYCDR